MCITYSSINRKLSISEMAQIHDISRQTLIYYDKIDLFKPEIIDEKNGYRYYSTLQIPLLREICFLRAIGMSLEDIRKNNEYNNSESTMSLLESQNAKIDKQIRQLETQKKLIEKRVQIYRNATSYADAEYKPTIETFPERRFLYHEWREGNHTRYELHYALMKIWNESEAYGILPSRRWGALYFKDEVEKGTPLNHAGGCCQINYDIPNLPGLHILPEGEYVCMPKFGMPYEISHINKLLSWIDDNNYEIAGDIYEECLLDSIFYDDDSELDFCEIQIPIRKKDSAKEDKGEI